MLVYVGALLQPPMLVYVGVYAGRNFAGSLPENDRCKKNVKQIGATGLLN